MKKVVYLIPGFMNNEKLWKRMIPLFDDSYEFKFLKIPHKDRFDEMADALFDEIKDEKANILGFSLGGYIASYFALKYPNRVNQIIAVACTPANLSKEECEKRAAAIEFTKKFGFKGLSRKKALSLVEPQNQNDEDLIQTLLDMYVEVGVEAFYKQFYSTIIRTDISQNIIESGLNFSFFYALGDRLVSSDYMNDFKKRANGKIKFKMSEAQTHMLPLERPNEVKEFVTDILG